MIFLCMLQSINQSTHEQHSTGRCKKPASSEIFYCTASFSKRRRSSSSTATSFRSDVAAVLWTGCFVFFLVFNLHGRSTQRNDVVNLRLVHPTTRFRGNGTIGEHGISTQRMDMSSSNRIAFRNKSMELGCLQTTRFANKMHGNRSKVLHDPSTGNVVQRREFHWNFCDVNNVVDTRIKRPEGYAVVVSSSIKGW